MCIISESFFKTSWQILIFKDATFLKQKHGKGKAYFINLPRPFKAYSHSVPTFKKNLNLQQQNILIIFNDSISLQNQKKFATKTCNTICWNFVHFPFSEELKKYQQQECLLINRRIQFLQKFKKIYATKT